MANNKLIYNPQLKDNFQFVFQGDINGTINTVALFVDGNKVGDSLITTDGESYFLNVPAGLWSVIGTNATDFINLFPDSSKIEVRRNADGFSGSLTWASLSDARTWTLPDASGVIALTSDLAAIALAGVLVAGNSSLGNNIVMTNTDRVTFGPNSSIGFDDSNADFLTIINEDDGSIFGTAVQVANGDGIILSTVGGATVVIRDDNPGVSFDPPSSAFSTKLTILAPTANRTISLPDKSGTVAVTSDIYPASFTTEKTAIAGSAAGAWITRSLGAGYANKLIRVTMENDSVALRKAGVREVGDANDLSFHMGRCHSSFEVVADGAGDIQIYSDDLSVVFWITGTKTI